MVALRCNDADEDGRWLEDEKNQKLLQKTGVNKSLHINNHRSPPTEPTCHAATSHSSPPSTMTNFQDMGLPFVAFLEIKTENHGTGSDDLANPTGPPRTDGK